MAFKHTTDMLCLLT